MQINGRHNLIFGCAPVFKGNDGEKPVIAQASEISENSVSSKAVTSYAQGLMNVQTNPIKAEKERQAILEEIRPNISKYYFEELQPEFQTTNPDKLRKLSELLSMKVINRAGEECPALWESSDIRYFLNNKCDLDSVIDCVNMTYTDEKGAAKNIFDAGGVVRLLRDGIDIKSPEFKKLATIMRDDANWHNTGYLYGDEFDKYGWSSEIFREESWKSRHRAPRFHGYEIVKILKEGKVNVNSQKFQELLDVKYRMDTGELRPALSGYEIVDYYNSNVNIKNLEKLLPTKCHCSNGQAYPMFSYTPYIERVSNLKDIDGFIEVANLRDFTQPNKPSIFYPHNIMEILDEGLDYKIIVQLAKETKKDPTGEPVLKHIGSYGIIEKAKEFAKKEKELKQILGLVKDEEFITLFEKFYNADRLKNMDEANKILDAYNNLQNNYTTLETINGKKPYYREYMEYCKKNKIDIKHGIDTKARYMDFIEAQRLDQLIDFCKNNDNELSKYMYENVYLKNKNLPPEVFEKLLEINKEFGTKVFLPSNISWESEEYVQFIKDELSEWKRASSGKAKYPPVIDLLTAKRDYIDPKRAYGKGCASGFCEAYTSKSVSVAGFENLKRTLRHEIMHANNNFEIYPQEWCSNGKLMDSAKEFIRKELLKGGIPTWHIDYAFNPGELVQVASEGEFSEYSEEFINGLKKMKMPDWCCLLRKIIR